MPIAFTPKQSERRDHPRLAKLLRKSIPGLSQIIAQGSDFFTTFQVYFVKNGLILPTGQWYAPSAVNYSAYSAYESIATVGEIRVWWRADFQSGSRVLKKVF